MEDLSQNKKIKVVLYNILFGMKGNTLANAVLSNLSMHGIRPALPFGLLPQWLRKITVPIRSKYLTPTLDILEKHKPDILCLNEILIERHKEELEKRLKALGFNTIVYGPCLHHSPPFKISLVLATKAKAEVIPFHITMAAQPGGGGGAGSLYIPDYNLAVLGVHIAFTGGVRQREMDEVEAWIQAQKKLGRKMLVVGDFNYQRAELNKRIPSLAPFHETVRPTCPSFGTIFQKCLDHIFYDNNFIEENSGAERVISDHKLVWSELASK
jgi:endonuclease/exonuclease/phosphatase family metal-dependent hydrolase